MIISAMIYIHNLHIYVMVKLFETIVMLVCLYESRILFN